MTNRIDYDWRDRKVHKGRLLLGDPIATMVQAVMDYANNINFLNRGQTQYDIQSLFTVFTQPTHLGYSDRTYLGYIDSNRNVYYPSKEQYQAICTLTGCQVSPAFDYYFTELNRATGRTFRIALSTVQQMVENPGRWITVQDHEYGDTKYLLLVIKNIVGSIGMQSEVQQSIDHRSYSGVARVAIRIPEIKSARKVLK